VAEKTRIRIQQTAARMGYMVNPLVSALMRTRRSRSNTERYPNLALITGHHSRDGWKISETLKAFHAAAHTRVHQRGFHMESIWRYDTGMTDGRFTQILLSRGIRAILLFPFEDPEAHLDLDWSAFATVALGFTISNAFDRVACDHFRAMRLAVMECHKLGYRKIAYTALAHMDKRVDERWLGGYLAALHILPDIDHPRILILEAWDPATFEQWLRAESPDVIIASDPPWFGITCGKPAGKFPATWASFPSWCQHRMTRNPGFFRIPTCRRNGPWTSSSTIFSAMSWASRWSRPTASSRALGSPGKRPYGKLPIPPATGRFRPATNQTSYRT